MEPAEKEMVVHPDFWHEGLPGFAAWVFQFMMEMG